jgi:predicted small secreted protein
MKKIVLLIAMVSTSFAGCETAQQVLDGVNTVYGNGTLGGAGGLSNADIVSGLKQALTIGTQNSTSKLSAVDGFFKDAAIKILLPEEAKKMESTL